VKSRLLIAVLGVALLVACAAPGASTGGSTTTTGSGGGSGEPERGGELVFARTRDNSTMDPVEAVETDTIYVLDHVFETLFAASADGSTVVPWLASDYELSEDGLTWTVQLREGVEFSNGQPLTSADVKFSIERAQAESAFGFLLSPIQSIETPDDRTVVFHNQYPWAPFLADLSVWAAAIVPADFAGLSKEEFFQNPIGTGPFMLDEWKRGEFIRLKRNENYWQDGKPYLDTVTWTQVPDENTRVLQLRNGTVHIASEIPLNLVDTLNEAPGVEAGTFPATTIYWLSFNTTVEPLNDPHVRRAIAYAIDQKAIADAVLFGYGGPACSVISPHVPFHDPETPCLPYDLDKARQELASSSVPDGFQVEYLVGDQTPDVPIAEIIQRQLKEIGIEVTLRPIDYGQFYSTLSAFVYEIAFTGWTMDIPDPDQKIAFMFDPELGGGDSYSTAYDNPQMIELVRAAQQALDPEARQQIYSEIQALAAEDGPFVPLILLDTPFGWRENVKGFWVNPVGKRHLEDVWLDR
jgi:peptide/nickel transport system substrate-binding protein